MHLPLHHRSTVGDKIHKEDRVTTARSNKNRAVSSPRVFPLQNPFTEAHTDDEAAYLRVDPQGCGVFNKGFYDSGAAECVWSHHQHLVLLHGVEERSHVGPDRLQIDQQKRQPKA